ncbi:21 kDa protein-like [Telopea speciosissima]|uniref:21 kDa protein-like n=1 Tax=Telopea speciosissima TaxID=54955 RepID=UPI001CC485E5|nr:21 kDa protein-like [Telopea speciosissima]
MEQVSSCRQLSTYYVFAAGILIVLVMGSTMNSCLDVRVTPRKTDTQFLRRSCGSTTHPPLCFNSLSIYAAIIQTNPKVRSTSTMMSTLSKSHGMKPREVAAMRVSNSIDELRNSLGEMGYLGGSNFGLHMSNIQTWVSPTLTEKNSCMDGFAGDSMNENVKITDPLNQELAIPNFSTHSFLHEITNNDVG